MYWYINCIIETSSSSRFLSLLTSLVSFFFFSFSLSLSFTISPSVPLFPTTPDVPSHTCRSHVRLLDPPPFTHTLVYESSFIRLHVLSRTQLSTYACIASSTETNDFISKQSLLPKCCVEIDQIGRHYSSMLLFFLYLIQIRRMSDRE